VKGRRPTCSRARGSRHRPQEAVSAHRLTAGGLIPVPFAARRSLPGRDVVTLTDDQKGAILDLGIAIADAPVEPAARPSTGLPNAANRNQDGTGLLRFAYLLRNN
jgi:hypothetical protein